MRSKSRFGGIGDAAYYTRMLNWNGRRTALEGHLAMLLQRECDRLDGVLAALRAVDGNPFGVGCYLRGFEMTIR